MSLMRYETWPTVARWHRDLDRLFDEFTGTNGAAGEAGPWQPRVDIFEFADRYEMSVDLPGVDPASVDIRLKDGLLELSGERPAPADSEEVQTQRRERPHGQFRRSFQLPDTVEAEGISAQSANGVINVSIPKRSQSQEIKVQVSS